MQSRPLEKSKQRYRALVWLVAPLSISSACDVSPTSAPDPSTAAAPAALRVTPGSAYRHPLARANAARANATPAAPIPFAETRNAADGRRYAVEEGRAVSGYGGDQGFSGTRLLDRRPMSAGERAAVAAEKARLHGAPPAAGAAPKIGPLLGEILALATGPNADAADAAEAVEVALTLHRPARPTVAEELEQAIARGAIVTRADYLGTREAIVRDRQAAIARAQAPVAHAVEALGGKVLARAQSSHFLVALMPADAVPALARRTDVARVELSTPDDDEVHGEDVLRAHQLQQLIDSGFDGENDGNAYDITFAQVEGGGADHAHLGFRESSGTTTRIRGLYDCAIGACMPTSSFSSGQKSGHASSVAGIIFGDLRDGQDTSLAVTADRLARSGYAGEARGWLYIGSSLLAFDHIAAQSDGNAPAVVNMSAGAASADPTCKGQDSRSRAANEMFESGKLLFKSAGNDDHPTYTDCTVTSPGSAIGVFTVASLGSSSSGDEADVRNATISSFSSRGGSSTEGGSRSIIDLAAYGYRKLLFDQDGGYTRSGGGTSYAAPTVTASAIDFIDHYKRTYSDLIDDPGFLFTNLLLMGDRQTQSQTPALSGHDNLYGAGRLRMRRLDNTGMDAPWRWSTGSACIDHGEVYTVPVGDGVVLSTDVDVLEAVVWWYDSRHEVDGTVDDIDLRLETTSGTTLRSSLTYDNKERVFYQGVGGNAVQLEISGYQVTADGTGCGTNSMKVYWAYLYEDSDRDDVDGPGADIDLE